jgi:hypothetical protein
MSTAELASATRQTCLRSDTGCGSYQASAAAVGVVSYILAQILDVHRLTPDSVKNIGMAFSRIASMQGRSSKDAGSSELMVRFVLEF